MEAPWEESNDRPEKAERDGAPGKKTAKGWPPLPLHGERVLHQLGVLGPAHPQTE